MLIRLQNRAFLLFVSVLGGLFLSVPLFSQYTIDLTDGICSHTFLKSAEQNARAYYNDLGVPKTLPALIDSSYADRDFIMSVIYIYLAHLEKGLEKTYLADLARVFFSAGCFDMADSLFKAHLDKNPDDYIAMCDYAVVLAEEGKHIFARKTVQKRIDENKHLIMTDESHFKQFLQSLALEIVDFMNN